MLVEVTGGVLLGVLLGVGDDDGVVVGVGVVETGEEVGDDTLDVNSK